MKNSSDNINPLTQIKRPQKAASPEKLAAALRRNLLRRKNTLLDQDDTQISENNS